MKSHRIQNSKHKDRDSGSEKRFEKGFRGTMQKAMGIERWAAGEF